MATRNQVLPVTYLIHCIGLKESGKSTLAVEFGRWNMRRLKQSEVYVVNNDPRMFEYKQALGAAMVSTDRSFCWMGVCRRW